MYIPTQYFTLLMLTVVLSLSTTHYTFGAEFIKFDGIEGESTYMNHVGWSPIETWDWSMHTLRP